MATACEASPDKRPLPFAGNSFNHPVKWGERSLSDLPAGDYMLRLHLENAEVFAVTLQ